LFAIGCGRNWVRLVFSRRRVLGVSERRRRWDGIGFVSSMMFAGALRVRSVKLGLFRNLSCEWVQRVGGLSWRVGMVRGDRGETMVRGAFGGSRVHKRSSWFEGSRRLEQ